MSGRLFGKAFKGKLLLVPNADTNPEEKHEISESALFRCLINEETIKDQALNCIDKLSKITEIETHRISMGLVTDLADVFHVFNVFKTTSGKDGDYWWSLEKNMEYIVLQRSRNKNDVKDKLYGEIRKKVKTIKENLTEKGTIKDLLTIFWAYQVITEKYNLVNSNCQSLVTLVSKQITEMEFEYKGYERQYSPQENDRNVEMLDLINILSMSFERKGHPLFNLIYHQLTFTSLPRTETFLEQLNQIALGIKNLFTSEISTTMSTPMMPNDELWFESGSVIERIQKKIVVFTNNYSRDYKFALFAVVAVFFIYSILAMVVNIFEVANIPVYEMALFTTLFLFLIFLCKSQSLSWGRVSEKMLKFVDFVPNSDTNREHVQEMTISEPVLFRFLLNEKTIVAQDEMQAMLNTLRGIDKLSKITEVEIHKSSMGSVTDGSKAFHVFILFKTTSAKDGNYWWSLEKNTKYIVLQRSRNKNDVNDKLYGEKRKKVQTIEENLTGKGTIKDLFAILWAYQVITEKYHIFKSNCQSLVTLVSKKITEIGYEFKGYFKYSPQENERNVEMLDLVNFLSMCFKSKGHPLFNLIYLKNPILFDIVMKSGKYDIDDIFTDHRMTTLHLAIVISSPEMVRHILEKWKADPTKRDGKGRTAIHLAALYAQENVEKIIDLLLKHKKVDINERDSDYGRTALHYAVCACNSIAVKHLINKGADPNIYDKDGQSPLHHAACHENGNEIMDLMLKAKTAEQNDERIDDVNEEFGTAPHMTANETTNENLIKKRANINCRDKSGCTPLHLAAEITQDMKIIHLLWENIKNEALARALEK